MNLRSVLAFVALACEYSLFLDFWEHEAYVQLQTSLVPRHHRFQLQALTQLLIPTYPPMWNQSLLLLQTSLLMFPRGDANGRVGKSSAWWSVSLSRSSLSHCPDPLRQLNLGHVNLVPLIRYHHPPLFSPTLLDAFHSGLKPRPLVDFTYFSLLMETLSDLLYTCATHHSPLLLSSSFL